MIDGARTHDNRNHNPTVNSSQSYTQLHFKSINFPTGGKLSTTNYLALRAGVGKFTPEISDTNDGDEVRQALRTFVSTVGLDEEMVRAYIRHQEQEDERYDQMKLGL